MSDDIVHEKVCVDCNLPNPIGDFYRSSVNKGGRATCCKPCFLERGKRSRAKAMADPEKAEKIRRINREYQRAHKTTDPTKIAARKEYVKAHYEANKGKYYANVSKRKSRKFGGGGSHSDEAWRQLCDLFGHKCLCCGQDKRLTRDHVVPVARLGSDDITNIQPLCWDCNKSKFTKGIDYRTREKVALAELNTVGKILFENDLPKPTEEQLDRIRKHETRSGYTGVYWDPVSQGSTRPWRARISINSKDTSLGRFATKEQAAEAYNAEAVKHYGPSAYVNTIVRTTCGAGT